MGFENVQTVYGIVKCNIICDCEFDDWHENFEEFCGLSFTVKGWKNDLI